MQRGRDIAVQFPGLYVVHHNLPTSVVPSHAHPEHHLIIPLQGEISVQLKNCTLVCGPGRMVYVEPHTDHIFRSSTGKGERLICLIDPDCWQNADAGSFPSRLLPASQLCKELLFYLLLNQKSKNAHSLIDSLVRTLAEQLSASPEVSTFEIDHIEGAVRRPELRRALSIARERFASDLSVAELARNSGMSVRNLSRMFQTEVGNSPKQLLMILRIEKAKEHLISGMTVTETAFAVGYNSLSQFIQQFRQRTGSIPSEYPSSGQVGPKDD